MPTDTEDPAIREDVPETAALAAPDEKAFWNTYSPRFEAPISHVAAALLLASFVGILSFILYISIAGEKFKPGAKMGTYGGTDDAGDGEEGGGGAVDPLVLGQNAPTQDDIKKILPDPDRTLPERSGFRPAYQI